jgi:hypothetical protein
MARNWILALTALTWLALLPGEAAAQDDIAERARAVEQKAAIGQYEEAYRILTELQRVLWERRPLGIQKALFVKAPAGRYGLYEPTDSSEFSIEEPLFVYLQPVGYGYERVDDLYRIAMTADFELRTPSGQVLAEEAAFARLSLESREPNREFQASFSFAFEGLDAGRYELVVRLRDENSGQRAETSLAFTVVEPADGNGD